MAKDKSGKQYQFLNFINARINRKHDNYELGDMEDTMKHSKTFEFPLKHSNFLLKFSKLSVNKKFDSI